MSEFGKYGFFKCLEANLPPQLMLAALFVSGTDRLWLLANVHIRSLIEQTS